MPLFETVPAEAPTELWTGALSPRSDLEREDEKGLFGRRLRAEDLQGAPVVSIGQPEVLRSLTSFKTPGFQDLERQDFYLLRLWCSFRDVDGGVEFERAHFNVSLRSPSDGASSLIARDLYPKEVLYKVKRDVHVALTPEIKFAEVGVKVGEFQYGFTYDQLEPEVVAVGERESTPSWTFSKTKSRKLQGGKAMHLVVAAPEGTKHAEAGLELIAHVTKPGFASLPMGLFKKRGKAPPATLEVRLW